MRVLATREGLVGGITASGWRINEQRLFVALPNRKALGHQVRITNPDSDITCVAEVMDVGPWNIDDPYADPMIPESTRPRPLAEHFIKTDGHGNRISGRTNRAGIDLGEAVWNQLAMRDNGVVDWEFIEEELQAAA